MENKIITDWLDKHGNPEIYKKVEDYLEKTNMKDEYVIINKTAIQKRIEEWESELLECYKAPVGEFNSDYVSTLQQAIATARDVLSLSTPLIPEIEKAYTKAFSEGIVFGMHTEYKYKTSQDYIANLKLDI